VLDDDWMGIVREDASMAGVRNEINWSRKPYSWSNIREGYDAVPTQFRAELDGALPKYTMADLGIGDCNDDFDPVPPESMFIITDTPIGPVLVDRRKSDYIYYAARMSGYYEPVEDLY